MDELGRLKSFKQGLFESGQLDENALTAQHEWKLDEQGNWREHREDPADSFLTPGLDICTAMALLERKGRPLSAAPGR